MPGIVFDPGGLVNDEEVEAGAAEGGFVIGGAPFEDGAIEEGDAVFCLVDGGDGIGRGEGEEFAPGFHGEGISGGDDPTTGGTAGYGLRTTGSGLGFAVAWSLKSGVWGIADAEPKGFGDGGLGLAPASAAAEDAEAGGGVVEGDLAGVGTVGKNGEFQVSSSKFQGKGTTKMGASADFADYADQKESFGVRETAKGKGQE